MKRNQYITWLVLLILGTSPLLVEGQKTLQPRQLDKSDVGVIYDNEWSAAFRLHTAGYGIGFNWGVLETYDKTQLYSIDLDFLKHPKEFRQNLRANFNSFSRPYVFGKINSFFSLKGSIGKKTFLSEKAKRKGVAIAMTYQGGLALGFQKPYYLEVINDDGGFRNPTRDIKYEEATEDLFLDRSTILGSSGFFKGLGETSVVPGLHGKFAMNFAWGAYDENLRSLDVGLMIEIYPRVIPIMIDTRNLPYFINFYINLQLGKRR